ncbi:ATPase [Marinobacter salinus]|uniref:ATPase n=1 Tax=Marinobacter salinus TaxID=1874317 RepID=A0A1D9GIB7_9GAMM|nr:LamG domain-containing protein [Marinobacter salinus]AOY87349.1 ATPase [Marinobacter salinus]
MTISSRQGKRSLKSILAIFTAAILLTACGGESTEQLPDTSANTGTVSYNGPAPATDDVLNFKQSVWDNLVTQDKCGACHNAGGQSPAFVNEQDINAAYAQANTVVNLSDPSQSAMVTKVAGGHNCWVSSTSVCVDLLTTYISNWAGGSAGSVKTVELRAPTPKDPGTTLAFPADSGEFASTVYPVLTTYCSDCHVEGIQTPYIGSTDIDTAYEQSKSRISLESPSDSRFVQRLRTDFHNCWDGDCATSADIMQMAIEDFAGLQQASPVDPALVTSNALNLADDGLLANSGGRYEDNIIALYEFKTGEGQTAFDTSGISPALNLTLSGNAEWVGGWGIDLGPAYENEQQLMVPAGKAQGSTSDSSKLHNLLTASGEYSIEAWVAPGNITQEDARIITYSGSATTRNVTLSQTLQRYEVLHRSTASDENTPFATQDADELLQATLQHVVVNYSPGTGRQIFVNGEPTGDIDPDGAGLLSEWDDSFALVLGNETDGNSPWQGAIRMVAIHNRALTPEQVKVNFDVGVGQKFYLLFGVSDLVSLPQSYIVFEVSQFDSYSYRFTSPFFISLDNSVEPSNIPLKGMRLGINGKEATVGQAWANLDVVLTGDDYEPGTGQPLSRLGTVIALENGPESDEFFLTFDQLGSGNTFVRSEPAAPPAAEAGDLDPSPEIGLKTFDEINESMARMTGVSKTQTDVYDTYITVKQQLPTVENIRGFLSSHQMAVTQMAIQYCNVLVSNSQLRSDFFPGFDFSAPVATAFDHGGRSLIIDPLLLRFVGVNLASQPTDLEIENELNNLMDSLTSCSGSCPADRTETVVKASCAAVLGSATTLVQ